MDLFVDFLVFLFWVGIAALVALPAGYYVFLKMVNANIFWTRVERGWCRIILWWGEYHRTVGPGLRWIGIPGMHTLYKRKMMFLKSVTDKDGRPQAEPHEDADISSFKTTDYAYAFPFKDEEDSHGLHLSGMLAVIAILEEYEKAFFTASDWYSIMNSEIMPPFRDTLAQISYDDDIVGRDTAKEQRRKTFSERLWKVMNRQKSGNPSVVEKLRDLYGIWVKSIELRSVDPPEGWRDTTLAPYKAQREKEAAKHQAEASAILFDDTNQALKIWLEGQRAAGHNPTQAQIEAKQDELRQRALAKTSGYQQIHIKGLEGATTAVVGGGGGAGVFVGAQGGGKSGGGKAKNPGGGQGNPQRGGGQQGGKTLQQQADEYFQQFKKYPKWDPLKRTPN
jgi:hypothetical protein